MSKHTWFLEKPEDGGRVLANDERHTIIHVPPCSPFNADAIRDARLIAAAPELLAALKAAMDFIDDVSVADQDITDETRRAWDALQKANPRAAIAKAEGGQDE